ncbi:Fur family transcriptional regulator, peroxide stress response regulator [Geoalkalibacter ferrihydriticus]|uniref:Fur family transcriptional regulator n=2 Tax=Geoalkalibacter ferrihydriticus TaxID=392333 RepID=A0A0C2HGV5_9BACT|nr:Fur family transcriptional regulator [Geoalkalibacter ferrihydriticus]KIH76196.1 Fur family transcriptional regulator [Geoalkalibacter ferrihydriticus DSM 17813]SDL27851.1 Fur family transcriptional regulator, peroxide stress response regulator [Geoalkalibacter ferrihydriticus]
MTPILKEQIKKFKQQCREHELRLTPQRLEIFTALAMSEDHPSAEQLYQRLCKKMPTLSLDTIYRTLATFVQHGLVNRVDTVESQARFEVVQAQHHHLICEKCKKISDFQWPSIECIELPEGLSRWGKIGRKNVVIYGICKDCMNS